MTDGDGKPERNSGRTGPRRLTEHEVTQRDQHAAADHRRRYGQPLPINEAPMPEPPRWFNAEQRAIWRQTLDTAPSGLLRAGDAHNLAVLCGAIDLHQRLTRQLAESAEIPAPEVVQQLRLVGAEVGRASKVLGLNPPERARIGLPATTDKAKTDKWGPFPTVIDGAKAA
jgi:phage terminase small subunit